MSFARRVSPVYFLFAIVMIVMVIRWAGVGDPRALAIVNLVLLSIMVIWGSWIERRKRRPPHRNS